MDYQGKKVVGVWIEHKHAYVIGNADSQHDGTYDVLHKIEAPHMTDHNNSEKTHHTKETIQLHHLYKDVSKHLESADAIYIIGPGTAQEELKNYLKESQHFKNKEIQLGTADHLTMNQMVAQVRTHFYHN